MFIDYINFFILILEFENYSILSIWLWNFYLLRSFVIIFVSLVLKWREYMVIHFNLKFVSNSIAITMLLEWWRYLFSFFNLYEVGRRLPTAYFMKPQLKEATNRLSLCSERGDRPIASSIWKNWSPLHFGRGNQVVASSIWKKWPGWSSVRSERGDLWKRRPVDRLFRFERGNQLDRHFDLEEGDQPIASLIWRRGLVGRLLQFELNDRLFASFFLF